MAATSDPPDPLPTNAKEAPYAYPPHAGAVMPPFLAGITLGQIVAALALIGLIVAFGKKTWPWLSRLKDFFDDMMGEPARPGVPARLGVMARLSINERATRDAALSAAAAASEAKSAAERLEEIKALASSAEYHSRSNHGDSAYDELMSEVRAVRSELADHVDQASQIHEEQAAAIAFLAEQSGAVEHLAEALPVVARSMPHEDDAAK